MRSLVLALLLALTACAKTELGPVLHEHARVVQTVYTPATHGSGIGPTFGGKGSGFAVVIVDTEPVYAVVLECQHGKFILTGKKWWDRFHEGEELDVEYQEKIVRRRDGAHLVGYHFRTATQVGPG